uniref:Uncharacterized protein n=1 Tax=Timema cristinae TaxID=61476 RepID=A0A7R9GQH8_TIMCR|nr:unnamed protein product [Timema cristinae]
MSTVRQTVTTVQTQSSTSPGPLDNNLVEEDWETILKRKKNLTTTNRDSSPDLPVSAIQSLRELRRLRPFNH